MTTSTNPTVMPQTTSTMTGFPQILWATRDLPQPCGAVAFTMLTTLLRPHELVRPTTTVESGMLHVADPHRGEGPAAGRVVPLPRAVRQILVRDTGPLTTCLGIPDARVCGLTAELRRVMADAGCAIGSLEQLWPVAVHGVMTAAVSARTRVAVLAFSGIHPSGKRATADRAALCDQDLRSVAALLDTLVVAAGFGLTGAAESLATKSA